MIQHRSSAAVKRLGSIRLPVTFLAAIVLCTGCANNATPSAQRSSTAHSPPGATNPIDRHALVARHNVIQEKIDPRGPVSVGNGDFAFTADITGLQTFPEEYEKGIPLCTQSTWGWHSFPVPAGLDLTKIRYTDYDTYGRAVGYLTGSKGQEQLFNYLRENPHRLNLGRIGLDLRHADGSAAKASDLTHVHQELDLWTGLITSAFEFDGAPVKVETACGGRDVVAARITSPLLASGRAKVRLTFPYGSSAVNASDWLHPEAHRTTMSRSGESRVEFFRQMDDTHYTVGTECSAGAGWTQEGPQAFVLAAKAGAASLDLTCEFWDSPPGRSMPWRKLLEVDEAQQASRTFWKDYWQSGGAIDLAGSTDPRAAELERRIVLSEYLVRVNNAGNLPPQETGLTCNSWYGKAHLEMTWWHEVHFAAWGRQDLFEKSMPFFERIRPVAQANAQRQGYVGARWPKMVGPDGVDSPSPIAPLLIWQQPHPLYYALLCYRAHPNKETLQQWLPVVKETADFMASYAVLDPQTHKYVLGPPVKTVPEHNDEKKTRNPTFELAYWRFGLRTAIEWVGMLGQPSDPKWREVLDNLSPLPMSDGLYLSEEGLTDTYTKWNWEHPSLVGALGVLPGDGVDPAVMKRTLEKVMQTWDWERCWGWDFPMTAMCAARVGRPDLAVDALMVKSVKNTYLVNGHNYQRDNLQLYLPGNGGLLAATAMMAAGWPGAPVRNAPGFPGPEQGWKVRWEGLKRLP